jgi:hypothetical protein
MNKREMQRELEWAKKQSKLVNFTLPEREPGEPPATEAQIRYIKTMSKDLNEGEIRKLGTKQVSSLIDQIKLEREMFTDEMIAKRLAEKSGCLSTILLIIVLYALFCLLM